MPYKLECSNSACRSRYWYTDREPAGSLKCECGTTLKQIGGFQKSVPTKGGKKYREYNPNYINRAQRETKGKKPDYLGYASIQDDDDDGSDMDGVIASLIDDDDGDEWLPAADFNHRMRLTPEPYDGQPGRSIAYTDTWETGWVRIGAPYGRVSTSQVMGSAILGKGTLAAWAFCGYKQYNRYKFVSAEWCHLVGDGLGGATNAHNLVAATHATNTYMLALEALLKGRTDCLVNVRTLLHKDIPRNPPSDFNKQKTHIYKPVALQYFVHKDGKTNPVEFFIDTACTAFSESDWTKVQRDLKAHIGKKPSGDRSGKKKANPLAACLGFTG